jgi:MoxR-like ATPase
MSERSESSAQVQAHAEAILTEVERAVVGKRDALELVLIALLADGHVLLEDNPGLAKTLIARSFATVTGLRFGRIQFTPDLMPSDITGASIYDQRRAAFEFRPGPIFTDLVLGDEVNRAPPKTQAALLEAMQERQVTTDDGTYPLPRPFLVLATQNPIEYEGTYPLPEAQLDRFMIRLSVGYPDRAAEQEMLLDRARRQVEEVDLQAVVDRELLLGMQRAVERVHVSEVIGAYMVDLVRATREHPQVAVGASPRGSLALLKLARAAAALDGRDFVTPDDVKRIAVPALSHRLVLKPEYWVQGADDAAIVEDCLASVPAPAPETSVDDESPAGPEPPEPTTAR